MPIFTADSSIDPITLKTVPEEYIIFYSSIVNGKLWCPDCRDVEHIVQETFGGATDPSALIVYVGDKGQWKTPSNIYRGEPWKLTGIPTVVNLRNGEEVGRLVDEVPLKLKEWVEKKGVAS